MNKVNNQPILQDVDVIDLLNEVDGYSQREHSHPSYRAGGSFESYETNHKNLEHRQYDNYHKSNALEQPYYTVPTTSSILNGHPNVDHNKLSRSIIFKDPYDSGNESDTRVKSMNLRLKGQKKAIQELEYKLAQALNRMDDKEKELKSAYDRIKLLETKNKSNRKNGHNYDNNDASNISKLSQISSNKLIHQLNIQLQDLQEKLTSEQNQRNKVEDRCKMYKAYMDRFKILETESDSRIQSQDTIIQDLQHKLNKYNKELKLLATSLDTKKKSESDLHLLCQGHQDQLIKAENALKSALQEIHVLKEELRALRTENMNIHSTYKSLQAEYSTLQGYVKSKQLDTKMSTYQQQQVSKDNLGDSGSIKTKNDTINNRIDTNNNDDIDNYRHGNPSNTYQYNPNTKDRNYTNLDLHSDSYHFDTMNQPTNIQHKSEIPRTKKKSSMNNKYPDSGSSGSGSRVLKNNRNGEDDKGMSSSSIHRRRAASADTNGTVQYYGNRRMLSTATNSAADIPRSSHSLSRYNTLKESKTVKSTNKVSKDSYIGQMKSALNSTTTTTVKQKPSRKKYTDKGQMSMPSPSGSSTSRVSEYSASDVEIDIDDDYSQYERNFDNNYISINQLSNKMSDGIYYDRYKYTNNNYIPDNTRDIYENDDDSYMYNNQVKKGNHKQQQRIKTYPLYAETNMKRLHQRKNDDKDEDDYNSSGNNRMNSKSKYKQHEKSVYTAPSIQNRQYTYDPYIHPQTSSSSSSAALRRPHVPSETAAHIGDDDSTKNTSSLNNITSSMNPIYALNHSILSTSSTTRSINNSKNSRNNPNTTGSNSNQSNTSFSSTTSSSHFDKLKAMYKRVVNGNEHQNGDNTTKKINRSYHSVIQDLSSSDDED